MAFITLIQAACQQTFTVSLPRNCAFFSWFEKISLMLWFVQIFWSFFGPADGFVGQFLGPTFALVLSGLGPL